MTKQILLWVEDNPSKRYRELIQNTANNNGLEYVHVSGVAVLQRELEVIATEDSIVKGIILDLMIQGVDSLADFGYPEVQWNDGSDTGEYLLRYVFRNKQPQDKLAKLKLHERKVLILTARSEIRHDDFRKYGQNIELAHKYDEKIDLNKLIQNWINRI